MARIRTYKDGTQYMLNRSTNAQVMVELVQIYGRYTGQVREVVSEKSYETRLEFLSELRPDEVLPTKA